LPGEPLLDIPSGVQRLSSAPDKWTQPEQAPPPRQPSEHSAATASNGSLLGPCRGRTLPVMLSPRMQARLPTWSKGASFPSAASQSKGTRSASPVKTVPPSPGLSHRRLPACTTAERSLSPALVKTPLPPKPRSASPAVIPPASAQAATPEPRPPPLPPPVPSSPLAGSRALARAPAAAWLVDGLQGSMLTESLQGSLQHLVFQSMPSPAEGETTPASEEHLLLSERPASEDLPRRRWRDEAQPLSTQRPKMCRTTDDSLSQACVGLQSKLGLLKRSDEWLLTI